VGFYERLGQLVMLVESLSQVAKMNKISTSMLFEGGSESSRP
jgi:hypothetical protein